MRSHLFFRDTETIQKVLPLYFQSWWLDLLYGAKNWTYITVRNADGFIIGLLPVSIKKKWGIKIITVTKESHYSGPYIIYDKHRKPDRHISYEHDVIENLLRQIPEVSFIYFQLFPNIRSHLAFLWKAYSVKLTYTYTINLLNPIATLEEGLKSSVRNHIRKSKSLNYSFEKSNDIGLFIDILRTSFSHRNKEMTYDLQSLSEIIQVAMSHSRGNIYFVKSSDGQALSGVFCLQDHERAYFLCGTNIMDQSKAGALVFCLWETICHFKEQGLKTFDFEGSDIKTIEHFFRGFGGDLTPIYRVFWTKNVFIRILAYLQNSNLFG